MKKAVSVSLACLLIVLLAQPLKAQTSVLTSDGFPDHHELIELPFVWKYGKIMISLSINGVPKDFILDTGAPTAVDKATFEGLNLPLVDEIPITDINGTKSTLVVSQVEQLNVQGLVLSDVPVIMYENEVLTACFGASGLLGSNIFQNSILQIDHQEQLIRIGSSLSQFDVDNAEGSTMFVDAQGSPVFTVNIGKNKEQLLFDSGLDAFYVMCNANFSRFKRSKVLEKIASSEGFSTLGLSGMGETSLSHRIKIKDFTFAGLTVNDLIAETDQGTNSALGSEILKYGRLTIDFRLKQYYFQPFDTTLNPSVTERKITPIVDKNRLVVGRVWDKKLKGLSVGDPILQVDGKQSANVDVCEYLKQADALKSGSTSLSVNSRKGPLEIFNAMQ